MQPKYTYRRNLADILCKINNIDEFEYQFIGGEQFELTKIRDFHSFIASRKPLLIISDSDADGLSSLAIVRMYFDDANIQYEFVTLDRTNRNPESLLRKEYNNLLLDCASGLTREIFNDYDLFVFDHHEPQSDFSNVSVINPKVTGKCEYLCTASLVYQYFSRFFSLQEETHKQAIQYAAIGTVADMVPLLYDNRAIVQQGLKALNESPTANLQQFCKQLKLKEIDETSIGFYIAPTINAASRFGKTDVAVNGYVNGQPAAIKELIEINSQRKKNTANDLDNAEITLYPKCVMAMTTNSKVAGLVATKLSYQHKLPTIVINNNGATYNFSIRSLGAISVPAFLETYNISGGGHHAAGGGEVDLEHLEWLVKAFEDYCTANVTVTELENEYVAIRLNQIENVYQEMLELKPFGMGWKAPIFVAKMQLVYKFSMGIHYKMKVKYGGTEIEAMYFNPPQAMENGFSFLGIFEITGSNSIILREVL